MAHLLPAWTFLCAIALRLVLLVALALGVTACASYTENMREAHQSLAQGNFEQALERLNEALDVDDAGQLPKKLEDERALVLLERATVLQALGHYEWAARDMVVADQQLEWLDFDASDIAQVSRYLYSDSGASYKAPAHERLLLNALNMLNFMAMGRLDGARVEARRFELMASYMLVEDERRLMPGILSLGYYLGGAAFEASRQHDNALFYYRRAWEHGLRSQELEERLVGLMRLVGVPKASSPQGEEGHGFGHIRQKATDLGPLALEDYQKAFQTGDTLVVVQTGMAPRREAHRVPIAHALWMADQSRHHHHRLEDHHRHQALELGLEGALAWVAFPALVSPSWGASQGGEVWVNGQVAPAMASFSIAEQVRQAWAAVEPGLMVAAITRTISRTVAAAGTSAVVTRLASDSGKKSNGAELLGLLAGLAVGGTLTAADVPDTRSWTTLPGQVALVRMRLKPGAHTLEVRAAGHTQSMRVDVAPRGITALNFSRHR